MRSRRWVAVTLLALIGLYAVAATGLGSGRTQASPDLNVVHCSDRYVTPKGLHRCQSHVEISVAPSRMRTATGASLDVLLSTRPHGYYGSTFYQWTPKRDGHRTEGTLPYLQVTTAQLSVSNSGRDGHIYNYGSFVATSSYAVHVPMEAKRAHWLYPFDTYSGKVQVLVSSTANQNSENRPVPLVTTVDRSRVNGWNVKFKRGAEADLVIESRPAFSSGTAALFVSVQRSNASVFVVLALLTVCIIGGVGGAMVLIAIVRRRRPPSISALAWFAASLFATLQIRTNLPDAPPIGSLIDVVITFPVIAVILSSIGWATLHWVRRDDWDLRNSSLGLASGGESEPIPQPSKAPKTG